MLGLVTEQREIETHALLQAMGRPTAAGAGGAVKRDGKGPVAILHHFQPLPSRCAGSKHRNRIPVAGKHIHTTSSRILQNPTLVSGFAEGLKKSAELFRDCKLSPRQYRAAAVMNPDLPSSLPVTSRQMRLILDVSRALAVPAELDPLLCQIAQISCALLGCERASIFLHDSSTGELWSKVALGSAEIRLPAGAGIVGHAFTHNSVVCVPEPYADSRFYPRPDLQSGFVTRNLLSAPMKGLDGKPIGAIECVNKVGCPFGEEDLALIELLADQAGVAVQRHHLQADAVRAAAMQREMDLARRAQEKLIPKCAPPVPGLSAAGWTLPASTTGGDCFDLWKLADGRLGVLLADASGHGLAPAMIIGQVRTLVRAMSEVHAEPLAILERINARLQEDLESGQFVTAFLGFISPQGVLHWASAGQGPIFLRPKLGEALIVLNPPILPLGIEPWHDLPEIAPFAFEPGGSLILVSDGLTEALGPADNLLGIDRVAELLNQHQHDAPAEVLNCLRDAVHAWHSGREPLDDQTIVVVQHI